MGFLETAVALLGPTAAVCFIGWMIEIKRHDKTRLDNAAENKAREKRQEELDRERIAVIRERTSADLETARGFSIFSERLAGIAELIKELIRFVQNSRPHNG
jgi:hypothetical protein